MSDKVFKEGSEFDVATRVLQGNAKENITEVRRPRNAADRRKRSDRKVAIDDFYKLVNDLVFELEDFKEKAEKIPAGLGREPYDYQRYGEKTVQQIGKRIDDFVEYLEKQKNKPEFSD